VFRSTRRVRLADVDPSGRARLDAMVRFLQDVAVDDIRDIGGEADVTWVVRRTTVVAPRRPRYNEDVTMSTWCSGVGAAWAERRTTIASQRGPAVEAVSLWVSLDPATMRPAPLRDSFFAQVGDAARRAVKSRLLLPATPPARLARAARPWALRQADFDVLNHVNNAVTWAAAEEEQRRVTAGERAQWGVVEHRSPIETLGSLGLVSERADDQVTVWVLNGSAAPVSTARFGVAGQR
jgi:acyl-ACP thioesterase